MDFRSPFAGLGDAFYLIDFYGIGGFGQTDYWGQESVGKDYNSVRSPFSLKSSSNSCSQNVLSGFENE